MMEFQPITAIIGATIGAIGGLAAWIWTGWIIENKKAQAVASFMERTFPIMTWLCGFGTAAGILFAAFGAYVFYRGGPHDLVIQMLASSAGVIVGSWISLLAYRSLIPLVLELKKDY